MSLGVGARLGYSDGHDPERAMTTLVEQFKNHSASRRAFVEALAVLGMGAAGIETARAADVAVAKGEQGASEAGSSTFVFAYLKLKPGTAEQFTKVLPDFAAGVEKYGKWKLRGCYLDSDGPADSLIDIWELPNTDAFPLDLSGASEDPAFQKLLPLIGEILENETLHLVTKLPVPRT